MKRKDTNRYWKYFSLLTIAGLLSTAVAWACASGDYDVSPFSIFAPELSKADKLYPFHYDFDLFYVPSNNWDEIYNSKTEDNVNLFQDINKNEWSSFFKGQVTDDDLYHIMYDYSNGEIDTLIFYLKDAKYAAPGYIRGNSINKVEDKAAAKAFLYYVGFANRAFKFSPRAYYYWDSEREAIDTTAIFKQIEGGKKLMDNVKYDFIMQRYYFQIVRLYFYAHRYTDCINYYNSISDKIANKTTIKYRILSYVAGANYRLQNYGLANYLYAVAFHNCDELKKSSYISFHPQEEYDWQQTLAMAKNKEELCALWFLQSMYTHPFEACKKLYGIDPKSEYTSFALTRLINYEEQEYGGSLENDYIDRVNLSDIASLKNNLPFHSNYLPDTAYANFLLYAAEKQNTAQPALWYMAAGYLKTLNADYTIAQMCFNKAQPFINSDTILQGQLRILSLVHKLYSANKVTTALENEILPDLQWLRNSTQPVLRKGNAWLLVKSYLAQRYYIQGDTLKSYCFDYSFSPQQIQDDRWGKTLVNFLQNENGTPYERFTASVYQYTVSDIYDLWGTQSMYAGNLQQAFDYFEKGGGMGEFWADPFEIHINDCHDCDIREYNSVQPITKYEFVKQMQALQAKALAQPKEAAQCYFDMANGFYNISYYGNNRVASNTTLADYYYWNYSNSGPIVQGYPDVLNAYTYYLKAKTATTDKEFAAKCTFMLAKCELAAYYEHQQLPGTDTLTQQQLTATQDEYYNTEFIAGTYYNQLRKDYSKTAYYKEVLKECGYFKLWAKK